jgi:hypothetical protein
MQARRKTDHWLELEPLEGRVSLSGIGRSLPDTNPLAFGIVPYGLNRIRCCQETNAVPVTYGSKPGGVGDG